MELAYVLRGCWNNIIMPFLSPPFAEGTAFSRGDAADRGLVMNLRDEYGAEDNGGSSRFSLLVWVTTFLLVTAGLHAWLPFPLDSDSAYHAAVGRIMRVHGILHDFPWTTNSWFADHYADKELLFHLLFVPVAGVDYVDAARIVGSLSGTLILGAIYMILRKEQVRFAGLWALVPLIISMTFLYRFLLVRPHLLSIAMALVVLWSAARLRLPVLAAVSVCYPLSYVAWHLPIVLVLIAETARFVSVRRISWKPLIVALCGITVGVLLHPNRGNLLRLLWIVIYEVLIKNAWGEKTGFDLGSEFLPETVEGWLTRLGLTVVLLGCAIFISRRQRKSDTTALSFTLAAVAFAVLTAKTNRFAEYFVPFTVVAFALVTRPLRFRFMPVVVVSCSLVYTLLFNYRFLEIFRSRQNDLTPSAITLLQQKVPVGAQVFAPDWLMTGTLMLALPERRFNVALDPTFFYKKDPELYRLWYQLPRDGRQDSAEIIRQIFHSRYVICYIPLLKTKSFVNRLASTPGVETFIVDTWILFDLGA